MLGMVEKVARAICRSMLQDPDIDYEVHHQDGLVKGWKMYESEARAAIEAMQMMWQPIETAPKDGTPVLIADGDYIDVAQNFWETDVRCKDVWTARESTQVVTDNPTHWMPLPPKPEAE